MKRFGSIFLAFLIIVSVSGCISGDNKNPYEETYLRIGLEPEEPNAMIDYVIENYSDKNQDLYYFVKVKDTPLTPEFEEFVSFLIEAEARLGADSTRDIYFYSSEPFKWAIEEGTLSADTIALMYDPDFDGLVGNEYPNPILSDADHDGLMDGYDVVTDDVRVIAFFTDTSDNVSLYLSGLFFTELRDSTYEFAGELSHGTENTSYDTDGDNKGDGFEYYLNLTDFTIVNTAMLFILD